MRYHGVMKTCRRCRRHLSSNIGACVFCGADVGVSAPLPLWIVVGLCTAGCVDRSYDPDTMSTSSATGMDEDASAGTSSGAETTGASETSTTTTEGSSGSSSSSTTETSSEGGAFYGAPSINGAFEQRNEGPHTAHGDPTAISDPEQAHGDGSRIEDEPPPR